MHPCCVQAGGAQYLMTATEVVQPAIPNSNYSVSVERGGAPAIFACSCCSSAFAATVFAYHKCRFSSVIRVFKISAGEPHQCPRIHWRSSCMQPSHYQCVQQFDSILGHQHNSGGCMPLPASPPCRQHQRHQHDKWQGQWRPCSGSQQLFGGACSGYAYGLCVGIRLEQYMQRAWNNAVSAQPLQV